MVTRIFKRGDIYLANLGTNQVGSEQYGHKPVVILQNNTGNIFSPTVIVAVITSKTTKTVIPTHLYIEPTIQNGLDRTSIVLLEQIRTLDKTRLTNFIGNMGKDIARLDEALKISVGLEAITKNKPINPIIGGAVDENTRTVSGR